MRRHKVLFLIAGAIAPWMVLSCGGTEASGDELDSGLTRDTGAYASADGGANKEASSTVQTDATPSADTIAPSADGAISTLDVSAVDAARLDAAVGETAAGDAPSTVRADAQTAESGVDASGDAAAMDAARAADAALGCAVRATPPAGPRASRSAGYTGTLTAYSNLYNVSCTGLSECASSCQTAGGTAASCTQGSECVDSSIQGKHCLPPTYWRYPENALNESADENTAAEQTLVVIAYNDPFWVSDFGVAVPSGAQIRGVQFDVRRSALDPTVVDDAVHIMKNGQAVGPDRRKTEAWPATLQYATYGGPDDLWGQTFAPADFASAGFGLSVAARYTDTAGNTRAYLDFVKVQVFYVPAGCP